MTTFEVDVAALRDLASRLKGLKEEFESQEDVVSGHEDAVGSDRVAGALEEFASNWSDKREEISKLLEESAGFVDMAADAYGTNEEQLSSGIANAATGAAPTSRAR